MPVNDRQQIKILSDCQIFGGEDQPPLEVKAGQTVEVYVGEAGRLVGAHLAELVGDVIPGDDVEVKPPTLIDEGVPPVTTEKKNDHQHQHHSRRKEAE